MLNFVRKKKTIYNYGIVERSIFAMKCMNLFDYVNYDHDVWKSVIFKYLQLIMFELANSHDNETKRMFYTKFGIIELFKKYITDTYSDSDIDINMNMNIIECLLTRKQISIEQIPIFEKTIESLHSIIKKIIEENVQPIKWNIQKFTKFDINPTQLSDELFLEWSMTPINLSDKFCEIWFNDFGHGNITINDKFIEDNQNIEVVEKYFPKLHSNIINVMQKTDEWKRLLKFYSCGNNTGVVVLDCNDPVEIIKKRYNLIMGCIGELIISKYYDFSNVVGNDFIRSTIGMIVEKLDVEGAEGCCPDQLFVNDKEIIPTEFKTIEGKPTENRGFIRSFNLASKQIKKCGQLLNKCVGDIICKRGIIVLLWIYYDDQQQKMMYEMHGSVILL